MSIAGGQGVTAVGVDCPGCRKTAVAHVVFDHDEIEGSSVLSLVTVECEQGCVVDVSDPAVLRKAGLGQ